MAAPQNKSHPFSPSSSAALPSAGVQGNAGVLGTAGKGTQSTADSPDTCPAHPLQAPEYPPQPQQFPRLPQCLPRESLALVPAAHTYRSRSGGQHNLGDSRTCTCQCSGSRCPRSGRVPRHKGPAYLGAEGRPGLSSAGDNCQLSSPGRGRGAVPISQCLPVKR